MTPAIYDWFLYTSGIYWGELFHHVFLADRRNDFIEFLVHHLATVFLVFGSAYANQVPIGVVISFIHLVSDISASFVKFLGSTYYDKCAVVYFVGVMMPNWFYWRLVCLPFWIYNIFMRPSVSYQPPLDHLTIFLTLNGVYLLVLQFLQFYWFGIFFSIVYNALNTGAAEDLQEDVRTTPKTGKEKEE